MGLQLSHFRNPTTTSSSYSVTTTTSIINPMNTTATSSTLFLITTTAYTLYVVRGGESHQRRQRRKRKSDNDVVTNDYSNDVHYSNITATTTTSSASPSSLPPLSRDVLTLRRLFATGQLCHPYRSSLYYQSLEENQQHSSFENQQHSFHLPTFIDLTTAIADACGSSPPSSSTHRPPLIDLSHPHTHQHPHHLILILCDGLSHSILRRHLSPSSFLLREASAPIRAVFPSTTPAALTSFATGCWPGRHGVPGWDLRDWSGVCDEPGKVGGEVVQIRILSDRLRDVRSGEVLEMTEKDVFVEEPWVNRILSCSSTSTNDDDDEEEEEEDNDCQQRQEQNETLQRRQRRRIMYINAYNGDDFQNWSQCRHDNQNNNNNNNNETNTINEKQQQPSPPTDFSSWQMGDARQRRQLPKHNNEQQPPSSHPWFSSATIGEISYSTLTKPSSNDDDDAVSQSLRYFRNGLSKIPLSSKDPTFTYLYTSQPDKSMHHLGVEHEDVERIVNGINVALDQFWRSVQETTAAEEETDVMMIVTADHGHVTIREEEMVVLPEDILKCLEYANVGVHGKGRHAYLHCKSGLQKTLSTLWTKHPHLTSHFLLLSIDDAMKEHLFGPYPIRTEVRPRMGDFVVISVGRHTLVTREEKERFKGCVQGGHGSLTREEMEIPFIWRRTGL